jgi:tape measure domain-containing protein
MADATLRVTADTREAERSLGRLQSGLKGLAGAIALGGLTKEFVDLSNTLTNLENKLRLVTQEGQTSADLFKVLNSTAINLGSPLKDVGDLFFRIANNTRDLGLAQTDQLRVTEVMLKAFMNTGVSMTEASGAVIQFGQALSLGTLRGEELNSILEQAPPIADAIAAKFGVTRGALKALGEQGKISSKDIISGVLAAGVSIDAAFASRIPTIANAFASLSNVVAGLSQRFDQQTGASRAISYAILVVADSIITVYEWFQKWGGAIMLVVEVLALILIPLKVMRSVFGALTGALTVFRSAWAGMLDDIALLGGAASGIGQRVIYFFEYFMEILFKVKEPMRVIDYYIGAIIAGLGGLATILGVKEIWDRFANLFSTDNTTSAERYNKKLEEINKRLNGNAEASNKATGATGGLTAAQIKQQGAMEKASVSRLESLDQELRKLSESYALMQQQGLEQEKLAYLFQVNSQLVKAIKDENGKIIGYTEGITTLEFQKLNAIREQTASLERQKKQYEEIKAAGESTITGAARAADPRIAVEQEYINAKIALENYFIENSLLSEETYQQSLTQLQTEYEYQRYQASVALEDKLAQYQQARYEQQLRQQQNILGQTVFGADQAKQIAADRTTFEKKSEMEKTQFAIDQAGQMFTALGQYNKKAFMAAKAFNIANAVMNTYMAATKALATYPPPFSFIAAGAAIAMGLAQVAQISSQQYSGRAIGGPVMGKQPYIVGERGPELMVPQGAGKVIPNNQLTNAEPMVINLNIQAVDARGVDQLIMERKGMIVGMIRSAMNDRGARAPL